MDSGRGFSFSDDTMRAISRWFTTEALYESLAQRTGKQRSSNPQHEDQKHGRRQTRARLARTTRQVVETPLAWPDLSTPALVAFQARTDPFEAAARMSFAEGKCQFRVHPRRVHSGARPRPRQRLSRLVLELCATITHRRTIQIEKSRSSNLLPLRGFQARALVFPEAGQRRVFRCGRGEQRRDIAFHDGNGIRPRCISHEMTNRRIAPGLCIKLTDRHILELTTRRRG